MKNNKCVYIHRRATDGTPFYVGCGSLKRANLIDRPREINHYSIYFDHGVDVDIVALDLSQEDAWALEIQLIAKYGRTIDGGTLVNISIGGKWAAAKGNVPWNKGLSRKLNPAKILI